jgi:glutamyl-tRNA synthetase
VIRLRAPQEGRTTIRDLVQGEVMVANAELDDLILLRADGTPTYNLSVVVDDHDMGITHVIRGDDHLNNAFRQTQIYRALDWQVPEFGHVPLIHGPDGAKLSKRHGAIGIEQYRDLGYLPEALRNYLLRLGWSHGDDEIISQDDAVRWFDIADVGRGAARFDQAKLDSVNAHYIREADDGRLVGLIAERLEKEFGASLSGGDRDRLARAMPELKPRAKTIVELAEKARFYVIKRPIRPSGDAAKMLTAEARERLGDLAADFADVADAEWRAGVLDKRLRDFAGAQGVKLGAVAQPLRAALTGSLASPGIFEVMEVLGRDESLGRIADAAGSR